MVDSELRKTYAECWGPQLMIIDLPDGFEHSIVQTQVQKQMMFIRHSGGVRSVTLFLFVKTSVIKAEYDRRVKVLMADGHANYTVVTKEASATAERRKIDVESEALTIIKNSLHLSPQGLVLYQQYGLLSEQLDVLTASWAAVPRAVKEQQPEQLRKLFRHDVELVAMHDAVDTAYKAWTEQTCDDNAIVEMPVTLQRFVERVRPPYAIEALSSAWILRAWFTPEHQHEYELVQRVVSRFTEIYENTEQYWIRKLDGAASRMERTQEQLERALESADMRVALIPSDSAQEELRRIQGLLTPETLAAGRRCLGQGKDAQLIPAGLKLMRRGQVSDCFKHDLGNVELHRRLGELSTGSDLRLLFGGDGYNEARKQASEAISELGAIIRVVRTAANAFPDVAAQCQELLDKHHKGELRAVTQDGELRCFAGRPRTSVLEDLELHRNKLRIQIQEKEAEEMVRTANIRLMLAEGQKKAAEEKLREAEQERVMAELAKQDSQKRADQWWENLQVMAKEKEMGCAEIGSREMLETEKGRLESEKLQWTQVQSLMELEKSELQGDIQKAKEERKRLEHAAEKWHQTLQTVKAQAEEKEALRCSGSGCERGLG
eukprot:g776.t1